MRQISVILLFYILGLNSYCQDWQTVGGGTSLQISCIYSDTTNNSFYVGGDFQYAGGVLVNQIAKWNDFQWENIGTGTGDTNCAHGCNPITGIVKYNDNIVACGYFQMMGGSYLNRLLSKWDGVQWSTFGQPNKVVLKLNVVNNELFALGYFDTISDLNIKRIAKWTGENWDSLGHQLPFNNENGSVSSITYYQDEYYVGGNFELGNSLKEIAKCDGTQWTPLLYGILGDSWVNDIIVYKGILYVAGYFFKSNGNAADYIMAWNGQFWYDPFPNIQYMGQIRDLEIINNKLYIVGNYILPNDDGMYAFANFDGEYFNVFGGRAEYPYWPDPIAIIGYSDKIFVACNKTLFSDTVNYIVQWLGNNDTSIYMSEPLINEAAYNFNIYPNPVKTELTINANFPVGQKNDNEISFKIFDYLYREVKSGEINEFPYIVPLEELQQGLYFIDLHSEFLNENFKFVKSRN